LSSHLAARLESPLPATLPVGVGTAVFLYGACEHAPGLEIRVGDAAFRPDAEGMPRPDLRAAPEGFRSGFWATVPIAPRDRPGTVEIAITAGGRAATLGRIEIVDPDPPPALGRPAPEGLIAVCMATFEPDPALVRAQIESLRAQTDTRWVCVISDDASREEALAPLRELIDGDERFVLSRSERRVGVYRNFERALRLAPAEAELIALCDQDDRWYPEKLAVLRGALGGGAVLAYSDQRLVDAAGEVLRPTLWEGRANNHTDLVSLLVANSITGAATLFRREVAELAVPFPDTPALPFHDHWIGLVALAAGDVAYVDRPLYDYVQHRGAVFGDVVFGDAPGRGRLLRGGRSAYFRGYLGRQVQARVLLARCAPSEVKRRALRRFVAADRRPAALAWLAGRTPATRRTTLGSELELVPGVLWRWLIRPLARWGDARIPDELSFQQRRLRRWRSQT
jgi:glycosyltransferase involved in cell wall biosynthesis